MSLSHRRRSHDRLEEGRGIAKMPIKHFVDDAGV